MRKAILCIALTCSAIGVANANNCKDVTIPEIKELLSQKQENIFANPFLNNCVNLITQKVEKTQFTVNDFDNREDLYGQYLEFSKNSEAGVMSFYDKSKKKLYQFFSYNEDDIMLKSMKDRWSKKKTMSIHFDDFLKLHEIAHLDHSVLVKNSERQNVKIDDLRNINHVESVADISSVIMLSVENDLSINQMLEILEDVQVLRKRDAKVGLRSANGEKIKDDRHYDPVKFNEVISFFEQIEKKDQKVKDFIASKKIELTQIPSKISSGEFLI